jgi:hypothetical protein
MAYGWILIDEAHFVSPRTLPLLSTFLALISAFFISW